MIEIIPSLYILEGKCVKVENDDQGIFDESPLTVAERFEEHGINKLHLVDLDGALVGEILNYHILEVIAEHTNLSVDFGGGVHTDGDINKCFEFGAKRVHISSMAVKDRQFFASCIISYGRSKMILSADVINGKISIDGRHHETNVDMMEHIDYFYNRGLLYLKCADITRDGTLVGPYFEMYQDILKSFPDIRLYAVGGVRNMDDVRRLEDIGVYGVIIRKALYEGKITLKEIEQFIAQPA
ncbi:MAG: 1-(5-phosphoribosyl)-5-[(5-phosphoribosylamino)methylideneamino] imidazole-4-carboxamide isomerase [Thermoflexibacter sp.]|jgi:phosphoribosylformimino-5-aminoimidazole carboxamide ribotide isomerase|nr:1-(5-phosphoribosyl)-5-[(5-phosphoribosylamino)methylideneamino] imidazole-4-carboxamide isomerase [Thermoflexibacter sp.]